MYAEKRTRTKIDAGRLCGLSSPANALARDLVGEMSKRAHNDVLLDSRGDKYKIEPGKFVEITDVREPKRIAFVDGGNSKLEESPSFLVAINRTYFALFRGPVREQAKTRQRTEFYSLVIASINKKGGERKIEYTIKLYTQNQEDAKLLPSEEDLVSIRSEARQHDWDQMGSLARRYAEWKRAEHIIKDELEAGDMLIRDGSLQTSFKHESKYAKRVYDAALKKGVIVCGLAKSSKLLTESGEPLLERVSDISKDTKLDRWYVKVADEVSADDRGVMLVAKFHPLSSHIFRFEILRDQYDAMSKGEINHVMASVAANCGDVSMLGYPYAAISADRFAQVRLNELDLYRSMVQAEASKVSGWESVYNQRRSLNAHDQINGVTS